MDREINQTELVLKDLQKLQSQIATKSGERKSKFEELQKRYAALAEENEDTDEELNEWKSKFDERIAILESKISKLLREKADIEDKSRVLTDVIGKNTTEIAKLQASAEAHMSLKNERDSNIKSLFQKHNLGPLPSGPFSDEVALDLTQQIQSKLKDLNKDLQEKKAGILKRIQDKEIERDSFEGQIADVDVAMLDERERNLAVGSKLNPFSFSRVEECKERIRGVLKGRLPPDKDLKDEIIKVQRIYFFVVTFGANSKALF
ncbi:UNVERIFIED_CONTAM: DNA repair protein [Sesamum radiatum]|uniref:DNA repair protein n=1 Tax=Sesamum radiatum TaxID=300843 RepID=A0AAW2NDW1_SESRA